MSKKADKYLSTTLLKGMKIIAAFSTEKQLFTLSELAVHTGLDKATCSRLANTFIHLGYVGRDENKKFYLEPRILRLGFAYLNGSELRNVAEKHLRKLSIELGYTANMAVLDDTEILIIFRNEIGKTLRRVIDQGVTLPAYCTSQGKVLLSYLHPSLALDKFRRSDIRKYTENTICTEDTFMDELENIRKQGYSICDQEYDYSFSSVAAPIFDHKGDNVAAVSFVYQPQSITEDKKQKLVNNTIEITKHLSFLIGYNPEDNITRKISDLQVFA
ncbi:MAG: IclR family transcriptional regulator [Desulfobulbaceae bacterium]|nr:IclR family transcriptional regulator [Desulfobulbaceae bacterium]